MEWKLEGGMSEVSESRNFGGMVNHFLKRIGREPTHTEALPRFSEEESFQSDGMVNGFFTRYKFANLTLKNALLLSVLFNFLLLFLQMSTVSRIDEVQVRVVKSYGQIALDDYPIEAIGDFAKDFVVHYTFWDHRNIEKMFSGIGRFLSPKLNQKVITNKAFKVRSAKDGGTSQRYAVMDQSTLQYENKYYAIFQGEMIRHLGGKRPKKFPYYFIVEVKRDSVRAQNGFGVMVDGFLEGPHLEKLTNDYRLPKQKVVFPSNSK